MIRFENKGASWLWGTFVVLYTLILFTKGMIAFVDHDEHQFISAAVLMVREGLFPFTDYTYIHSPYLSLLLSIPVLSSDALLFGGRLLSALAMSGSIALLLLWALKQGRSCFSERIALLLSPMLLLSSEAWTYTSSRVWEHPPALLFLTLALLLLATLDKKQKWLWAAQGFFSAFACLIRIGYAPLGLLMFVVVLIHLHKHATTLYSWLGGVLVAFIPMILFGLIAPDELYFGLWTFHTDIDPLFLASSISHQTNHRGIQTLIALANSTDLIPLYLFSVLALLLFPYKGFLQKQWNYFSLISFLFFIASIAVSVAKGIVFLQYLALPLLFLWIFAISAIGSLKGKKRTAAFTLLLGCSLLSASLNHKIYWRMNLLFQTSKWTALNIHRQSVELFKTLPKDCKVFTLSPLFALEAGKTIHPELANGPFLWRTAPFSNVEQRKKHKLIGIEAWSTDINQKKLCSILIGHEEGLEHEIKQVCERDFTFIRSEMGLNVYVSKGDQHRKR